MPETGPPLAVRVPERVKAWLTAGVALEVVTMSVVGGSSAVTVGSTVAFCCIGMVGVAVEVGESDDVDGFTTQPATDSDTTTTSTIIAATFLSICFTLFNA